MGWKVPEILWLACIAAGAADAVQGTEPHPVITDSIYTHAQRLVDVGNGRKMNLHCSGSGAPTVVLDSGLSDPGTVWGLVQPTLSKTTRVCSYDRAGIGYSDPSQRPSTSENVVEDLRALLRSADVAPPYVLVGHSLGGLHVQLYAYRHPAEVSGMVLIDPANDYPAERSHTTTGMDAKVTAQLATFRTCAAASLTGFRSAPDLVRKCVDTPADEPNAHFSADINAALEAVQRQSSFQAAQLSEFESAFGASADQVRAARRPFGALPLVVLTSSAEVEAEAATRVGLAALSTRGIHRTVPRSGHYVQLDQPESVVIAIEEVIALARTTR